MAKLVRDVMLRNPPTVPADMPYLSLLHMFVAAEIGGVPVVDGAGRVQGLVTTQDLLRAVDQACDEDLDDDDVLTDSSSPDDGDHDDGDGGEQPDAGATLRALTAGDVAASEILWVDEDAPLEAVVAEMRARALHRALVGSAGDLRGMLTAFYLLAALEKEAHPTGA
jgi:CBS domain-containing protein